MSPEFQQQQVTARPCDSQKGADTVTKMFPSKNMELWACDYFEMFYQNNFANKGALFLKEKLSQQKFCFHHHFQVFLKEKRNR